jgi:dimethylargininase
VTSDQVTTAIVHQVGDALLRCELTFVLRQPLDVALARRQHADYCRLLADCGLTVRSVDVCPDHADAVFVEDTAVVLAEVAIAAAIGAPSRRGEVEAMLPVLATYRPIERITAPATLDGGDVLRHQRTLFVGLSTRTNAAGAAQLARLTARFGYRVVAVPVRGCLHLKTACTAVADDLLLCNPHWVDAASFGGLRTLAVPDREPFGANVLRLGDTIAAAAGCPRTCDLLAARGLTVRTVDIGELQKAEAGMTCLSLLLD